MPEISIKDYIALKSCYSNVDIKIPGANPHKANIVIKHNDDIITVPYYFIGVYYPHSRYQKKHDEDEFTQFFKQFKPFEGVTKESNNKAISLVVQCMKTIIDCERLSFDVVVPVPSHKPQKISYPLKEITRKISQMFGAKDGTNVLVRVNEIPDHRNSSHPQRKADVQYETLSVSAIEGRSVLLVDDLLTSGNTMAACIMLLKENGVSDLYVFTVGRTKPEDWDP